MLRMGYALMMLAGAALVAFGAYHMIRVLILSSEIGTFFKVLIPIAGLGVLLTLVGLIRERMREERDAHRDD